VPIVDDDTVLIKRATRSGSTKINVEAEWRDSGGELLGTFAMEWKNTAEAKEFLESQTIADVMRAVLLQCLNQGTGNLIPAVFDALPGKTFRVLQRVQQI